MDYNEKELEILRKAVDIAEKKQGFKVANSPEVKKIIKIVEKFIKQKELICYGGTAINNILPQEDQFYDKSIEIPDYDFFSTKALDHAKELADIYAANGYSDVEAKAGIHKGTYKVFVNYIPVADITHLDKSIFSAVKKEAIKVGGILYTPPDYLRMSAFLELSRPQGDVSRWEKVLKRLQLLNNNYPVKGLHCNNKLFQRSMEDECLEGDIYNIVKNALIDSDVVFFGGFANAQYGKYFPKSKRKIVKKVPDFDVLSNDPLKTAAKVEENLKKNKISNIKIIKHPHVGEIINEHYEVRLNDETLVFIYKPLGCHSYNILKSKGKKIKIATIDTMLSYYLAFIYANREYYDKQRISCMSQYLYEIQEKNKLNQKGLLRRFSLNCYGTQSTLESMRDEKSNKFRELKEKKGTKEYDEWFLKYTPLVKTKSKTKTKKEDKKRKNKTIKKKKKGKN